MSYLKIENINSYLDGIVLGETLKTISQFEDSITFDGLMDTFNNTLDDEEDIKLDEIGLTYEDQVSKVVTFLDCIGVSENVINDLMSDNDEISCDSLRMISKSFDSNFETDDISNVAVEYASKYNFDNIVLDSMPPRKAGYKKMQVVKDGKKTWVNKRVTNKKVRQSPAQRRALKKARMKAHTGTANRNRKKSVKKRSTFAI